MVINSQLLPYIAALAGLIFGTVLVGLFAWRQHRSFREQTVTLVSELEENRRTAQASELKLAEQNTRVAMLESEKVQASASIAELNAQLKNETEKRYALEQKYRVADAQMQERQAGFERQIAQFEQQKDALKKEFELLANKVFEEKSKVFSTTSKTEMDQVLRPFKDQIEGFQKRVNEVHTESVQGNSKLEVQIKHVLDVGLKMSGEAQMLATALKGDKKAQGSWSEVQAELLLEMSGLKEGREFEREANYKTEDGRDQRPDFIINLPNEKHIILDSKISLNAYLNATGAESDSERELFLKQHVDAIKAHVKTLSDKNYAKLKGVNSPDFVFMFIGNEPAYLAAADFDSGLYQEAYRKGIAIVTPNTLLACLRIISHLWSIDKQNSNTRELAEQASKVYDKLRVFVEKMEKLGNQISTVKTSYEQSWSTLKDGRGSLVKQVDKFVDMGVTVKEKLPSSVVENTLSTDED